MEHCHQHTHQSFWSRPYTAESCAPQVSGPTCLETPVTLSVDNLKGEVTVTNQTGTKYPFLVGISDISIDQKPYTWYFKNLLNQPVKVGGLSEHTDQLLKVNAQQELELLADNLVSTNVNNLLSVTPEGKLFVSGQITVPTNFQVKEEVFSIIANTSNVVLNESPLLTLPLVVTRNGLKQKKIEDYNFNPTTKTITFVVALQTQEEVTAEFYI